MRLAPSKLALYSLTALAAALLLSIMLSNSDGASAQQAASPTPLTRPIALSAISAGAAHTCGLRPNGAAVCWGWDYSGQSTPPEGVFTSISAGYSHTCGLRPDGAAVCWGWNNSGQSTPPTGVFTSIKAGTHHTCGLRPNGVAQCWGSNEYGQSRPPSGYTFKSISVGGHDTSCGIVHTQPYANRETFENTLACWGQNHFTDYPGQRPPHSETDTFISVSSGTWHTCALRSNGAVKCFADNVDNRGSSSGQASPPVGETFASISVGAHHSCGLRANGTAACWGSNRNLTRTKDVGQSRPPAGETFTSISAGWYHTCGLRANGTVVCWGSNGDGQATPPTSASSTATPTLTPTSTTVSATDEPTHTPTNTPVTDDSTPRLTPTSTSVSGEPTPTPTATRVSTPTNSNANGRISRLEGQVGTLQNQVKTQQEQIETQKGLIETQRGQLETQKGQIQTQRGFIDSLRALIRALTARLDLLDGGSAATPTPTHTPTPTNTPVTVLDGAPTPTPTTVPTATPTRASRSTLNPACIGKIGLGWLTGAWNADCQSTKTPPTAKEGTRYARYYAFTLDAPSRITVTISSTEVRDTYLYLLRGSGNQGEIVNRSDTEIVEQLDTGTYTIEATTYNLETAGAFTLTMDISTTGVSAAAGAPR